MQSLDLKLPRPNAPKQKKKIFRLVCLLIVLLFLGGAALYRFMEDSAYESSSTLQSDSETSAEAGFSVEAMQRAAQESPQKQAETPVAEPVLAAPAAPESVSPQKGAELTASPAAPEPPAQPAAETLDAIPFSHEPAYSAATQQLMALQVQLELKKLQLAVTEVDAQIAKSDAEIMKLQAPVFMPAQAVSQAPAEAVKEPVIVSIQGMNGAFNATIRTSAGLQTVKVGDAVNAAKVESITLESVVLSENGQSKSLAFED